MVHDPPAAPSAAGPSPEIVADVRRLVAGGAREITCSGRTSMPTALTCRSPGRPDLADVLEAVHGIEELWRIRFLTSHPQDMSPAASSRGGGAAQSVPLLGAGRAVR